MSDPQGELWTVEEFAAWMKITETAARAMLRRRNIPAEAIIKIGRRVRILAEVARPFFLKKTPA